MKPALPIKTLFLDVGGVLLTDGWDHLARRRAARHFELSWVEMEERHPLMFDTYEEGKLTLEQYLDTVVFYRERPFTRAQFRSFMFAQSKPLPNMIGLVRRLKDRYRLKVAVVSNEARELNEYRIRTFKLDELADFFISSCIVHLRKPDPEIFRLALDVGQCSAAQTLYLENTPMFVETAARLGIRGVLHTDYASTCAKLAAFGLRPEASARTS